MASLALDVLSASAEDAANPWAKREECVFGMPYLGQVVRPRNQGALTAVLKAVYAYDGIDLRHEALPYERALEGLRQGAVDCTLVLKGDHKGVLQGETTLATYDLAAAYLRETGWVGIQSLKDQRVAYLHGFDLETLLPVPILPQLVYDLSSAYHMLERGHVTYVLDDVALLRDAMYDSQLPSSEFSITEFASYEVRPIFADTPKGRRLRDIYDRRMKVLIETGDFVDILKKNGMSAPGIEKVLKANGR